MNKKWLAIAAEMLEKASGKFSNYGCNDWDFPNDWTDEEKIMFVGEMHKDNHSEDEFEQDRCLNVPDWWVMSFLARRLKLEVESNDIKLG